MAKPGLVVQLNAASLVAFAERGGQRVWQTEYRFEGEDQLAEALASLGEPVRRQRLSRRVLVVVEPPVLQRRILSDIPPVGSAELRRLIWRATPRYFRQNGHALVSAAEWERESSGSRRLVRAVAFDLPLAEAVVSGVQRAGLHLTDIVAGAGEIPLSLLPPAEQLRRHRACWLEVAKLAGLVVLLWIGVAVFLGVRLSVESTRLQKELSRLSEPRQALAAARRAMNNAADMVAALDEAQSHRNDAGVGLRDLVDALPESDFLTAVSLDRSGPGSAAGLSRSMASMAKALEGSAGVGPMRIEGTGGRDSIAGAEWERFSLVLGKGSAP